MALGSVNVGPSKNKSLSELGALPQSAEYTSNANTQLTSGKTGENIITLIHRYDANTLNTPYKAGLDDFAVGNIITFAYWSNYATQMCIPSGSDICYTRGINNGNISEWVKVAKANDSMKFMGATDDLDEIIKNGVFGWYEFYGDTANTPSSDGVTGAQEGVVLNIPDNGYGYAQQFAFFKGNMVPVYRHMNGSSTEISAWEKPFVPYTGCTMQGSLVAQAAQVDEDYTTAQVRNVIILPEGEEPTGGNDGDMCVKFAV